MIEIKKIGITKADVDCVVNAANSGLWEGGGVCGAIFREAGSRKLQQACNAIGGCEVGSAVITPGFDLKAKYIIHAVGPQWNGGNSGEEQLLYNCYQESMKLAEENDCHSIAFPLISSGIFGYPKRQAWEVAIRSVMDYQKTHNNYSIAVTFAVLADDMLIMGNDVLTEAEAKPVPNKAYNQFVRFHRPEEKNGFMSNWYMSDFVVDGKKYCCAEQYMMEQKALLFGDDSIAAQIMQTTDPQKMQDLGKQAKGFVPCIWDGRKQLIVYKALCAKFQQNTALGAKLIATGTAIPIECSKSDRVWGIGMGMRDPDADKPEKWNGKNLLGFALMQVKQDLIANMLLANLQ